MDLALTINAWIDEEVIFAQQLGARVVFARVEIGKVLSVDGDRQPLARLRNRIEKAGLVLAGLRAAAAPGGKGRQEEILTGAAGLVQEAGAAGIGMLSLSAKGFPTLRSSASPLPVWAAPQAEAAARAGVRLAVPAALVRAHPDRQAQGGPIGPENMLHSLPPSIGLDASPAQVLDWLQNAAPGTHLRQQALDRLWLVSFENERRSGPRSGGNLNNAGFDELLWGCWRLRQAGYPGLIRLGQPSRWKGDSRAGHQARAFSSGYLRALLQAFQ